MSDVSRRKTVVPAAPSGAALVPAGGTGMTSAASARRGERVRAGQGAMELLAFVVGREQYALPLASIREILRLPAITEVPRAPGDVMGIISVRGRVTSVVDLRRRLRMPEAAPTRHSRVLLVEGQEEILGLLVDRVDQVYRLREEEVELATTVAGGTAEHVFGIGRPRGTRDDILILLDPESLLRNR